MGDKKVKLRLIETENGIALRAVDEDGHYVSNLIEFRDGSTNAYMHGKHKLEENGYDTSFANWDYNGRIQLN